MAIGSLLLIALIVGSFAFAANWSHADPGRRTGGIFVFAILWILWWSVGFPHILRMPRNNASQDQQHFDAWHVPISVEPNVLPPPKPASQASRGGQAGDVSSLAASEVPVTTGKSSSGDATAFSPIEHAKRPDWMNEPPSKHGDVYVVSVESGVYADPSIRDQMLEAKMVAAANRYIDELMYRQGGVADVVTLDADYLQNFVREHSISPAKDEIFVQLEFNKRFRDEVDRRYKSFLSLGRLEQLGGIAAGAIVLLGGLYCYLRATQPRTPSTPANSSAEAAA